VNEVFRGMSEVELSGGKMVWRNVLGIVRVRRMSGGMSGE